MFKYIYNAELRDIVDFFPVILPFENPKLLIIIQNNNLVAMSTRRACLSVPSGWLSVMGSQRAPGERVVVAGRVVT